MAMAGRALGVGRVNNDGTFELRGLAGPQLIRARGLPTGWAVKSISLDGTDITDAPFDFKPGTRFTGLVVTLTDRITEISGAVRDSRGQPVTDYVLVVFPEDAKLWGAQSRHVATSRPNQNGSLQHHRAAAGPLSRGRRAVARERHAERRRHCWRSCARAPRASRSPKARR